MRKFKKITSLLLACVMSVSFLLTNAVTASAAGTDNDKVSAARIWNGKADTSWFTKNKKKDTYNISTAEQLAGFAKLVEEAAHEDRFRGVTINLTNDIVLNDTSNWENWREEPPKNTWNPIGKVGNPVYGYCPFAGVFNGNGHTISGMYVNCVRPDGIFASAKEGGLFSYISGAIVCNLKIEKSVVIGESTIGGLTALSENSYIDSVEINNVKLYSDAGKPLGGVVGEAGRVNMTLLFFNLALLGAGVLINPILFADSDETDMVRASYVNNCKSIDVDMYTTAWTPSGGGIMGEIYRGGIQNSISVNCTFQSLGNYSRSGAHYGAVLGQVQFQGECNMKNCYSYGYSVKDDNTEKSQQLKRSDEDQVKSVSRKKLYSKDFAKKLGKGFSYVSNGSPRLTAVNYPKVNIVLGGSKATLSWRSVSGAKTYKVYVKDSDGVYAEVYSGAKTQTTLKNIKKGNSYDMLVRWFDGDGSYTDIPGDSFILNA